MNKLHSPGPWTLDWNVAGGGCLEDYPELQYVNIRSANYFKVAPDGLSITGYVRLADANLIAAAPDLLSAAKEALASVALGGCSPSARSMLADAIAKAEGQHTKNPFDLLTPHGGSGEL